MHTLLTPTIIFLPNLQKEFSARGVLAGFVGEANNCTIGQNPTLADVAVLLYSAYASDNKLIIYRFKRGLFVGMYKKKELGLLWPEKKETSRRLMLLTVRWVTDV